MLALLALLLAAAPAFAQSVEEKALAVKMAQEAALLIEGTGAPLAFKLINDPAGHFADGTRTTFVMDLRGKVLAHSDRARIGQTLLMAKDARNVPYVRAMLALADEPGEGWVDYTLDNPQTRLKDRFATYVRRVEDMLVAVEMKRP